MADLHDIILADTELESLYREVILEEAAAPFKKGQLSGEAKVTHQSTHQNASCGDAVSVQVVVDPQSQKITDLAWQGQGCIISQASMSAVARSVIGKKKSEVLELAQADILDLLGLTEIVTGRTKCLELGLKTLQAALKDD